MSGAGLIFRRLRQDRSAFLGAIIIAALVLCALLAPVLAPFPDDVWQIHPAARLQPPGAEHLMGTDRMGSDVLSRILFGARITLVIAIVAVGAALLIGVGIIGERRRSARDALRPIAGPLCEVTRASELQQKPGSQENPQIWLMSRLERVDK